MGRSTLGDRIEDTSGYRRQIERTEAVVGQSHDDMLTRFGHRCVVAGINEIAVLDLAHVLPSGDRPDLVETEANVLVIVHAIVSRMSGEKDPYSEEDERYDE